MNPTIEFCSKIRLSPHDIANVMISLQCDVIMLGLSCLGWGIPLLASWLVASQSPEKQGNPHPDLENGIPKGVTICPLTACCSCCCHLTFSGIGNSIYLSTKAFVTRSEKFSSGFSLYNSGKGSCIKTVTVQVAIQPIIDAIISFLVAQK